MAFEFLINNLWAVAVIAIIIAFIVGYKIQSRKVSKRDMRISELEQELKQKQTKAYTLGISQMKGDICQILGTFGILEEYQDIIMLSTTTIRCGLVEEIWQPQTNIMTKSVVQEVWEFLTPPQLLSMICM